MRRPLAVVRKPLPKISRSTPAGVEEQVRQTRQLPDQYLQKTSINYYLRMEICASLAILPDQCLICLTKVQLLPPPLPCKGLHT